MVKCHNAMASWKWKCKHTLRFSAQFASPQQDVHGSCPWSALGQHSSIAVCELFQDTIREARQWVADFEQMSNLQLI